MEPTIDLDEATAPAAAHPQPDVRRWTMYVPWAVVAVLVVALAFSLRQPEPAPQAAYRMALPPAPTVTDPVITSRQSDGVGRGPTVWRDASGQIIAVMDAVTPYGEQPVWCELAVGGQTVRDEQTDGRPAICVWLRDAA